MPTNWDVVLQQVILSLLFTGLGVVLFGAAFWLMSKVTPFSIREEIETDQNTALAIVMASVILGIALIVAAAIHG
ncbi:MAG: DUF350 domain-containing protein [Planctomycetes bacterium]|nr:DUF350 domain-containing protein [Planctomycetota bacterium]